MASSDVIEQRRRKMIRLMAAGASDVKMSEQLKITVQQVARERKAVKDLIKAEALEDLTQRTAEEVLLQMQAIIDEEWVQYTKNTSGAVRQGNLTGMMKAISEKVSILQSLGLVAKRPDKLDIKAEVITPDALMVLLADVGRDLPDDARAKLFSRLRERMKPDE